MLFRSALREYVVAGIKTTVPFFTWLFDQPAFHQSAFHTTYLDEILEARNGRPFVEPDSSAEDVAIVAAALQAVLSPRAAGAPRAGAPASDSQPAGATRWKTHARSEALR